MPTGVERFAHKWSRTISVDENGIPVKLAAARLQKNSWLEVQPGWPVSQNICAVIVTYFPDSGLFYRIERANRQVARTIIVDNGSPESCVAELRRVTDRLGVHLILNSRNQGVARALNQGAEWALSQRYRWILTLDQDSKVAPEMVDSLVEVFRYCPFRERLAVIGSNYHIKVGGEARGCVIEPRNGPGREAATVITSGSLVSLDVFRAIGGFREDFFIDCVDHEYCLRARAHGFRVMITHKPLMEHSIGDATEHRFPWQTPLTYNHSPLRQYFIARNTIMLVHEYILKEPKWILAELWIRAKSILKLCFFEKERSSKLQHIFRGIRDGILRRAGSGAQEFSP